MDAPPPHTLSAHQKLQVHITTAQTTQKYGLVFAHQCHIALNCCFVEKGIGHKSCKIKIAQMREVMLCTHLKNAKELGFKGVCRNVVKLKEILEELCMKE